MRIVISKRWRAWDARHDWLSAIRQEKLAVFLVFANVVLFILFQVAKGTWDWNVSFGPMGGPAFFTVWFASLLLLGVAALAALGRLAASAGDYIASVPAAAPVDLGSFDTWRKYPYYSGVSLNILAIALLVEQTGGLIRSPFVPVLYAIVLGGQQLGRYRNNSRFFITYGVSVTLGLMAFEYTFGLRRVPPVPDRLQFVILATTFAAASLFNHVEKLSNYHGDRLPIPTFGAINLEGTDSRWRFELYAGRRSKLEPYLPDCSDHADSNAARAAFEAYVQTVIAPLEGTTFTFEWREIHATRFVAKLVAQ